MSSAVEFSASNRVGVITLNRPGNRNSMTPELLDSFVEAIEQVRANTEIRALVITGKGPCFSAGADFNSEIQRDPDKRKRQAFERSFALYEPFLSVLDVEVPVIAAINGHAVGGGFGLALLCDLRLASRSAKLGATFTRLGLTPGLGISYLLPRLVGASKAAELLFTGELVSGDQAEQIGLVSHALDTADVLPNAMAMASKIAANAPVATRLTKATMRELLGWDVRAAARREALVQATTIDSDEAKEGVLALLSKREPSF